MTSIHERLAAALFPSAAHSTASRKKEGGVRLSFFEICGDDCVDLLNMGNAVTLLKCHNSSCSQQSSHTRARSHRLSTGGGAVADAEYFQAFPAVEPSVHSAADFLALIGYGTAARKTAATGSMNIIRTTSVYSTPTPTTTCHIMSFCVCLHVCFPFPNRCPRCFL